jgi:putative ABC transport system permease protein
LTSVGREVAQLDASLPIANVRTLADLVSDARAPTAFAMTLLGMAALVALFLGAIGVYGVQSYMVSQRTGEIGVRMALGASATDVSRMILERGGAIALGGIVLGWSAALLVTRWMESLLFDVPPTDIWTHGAVSFALVSAMLAASYLPARRAASQDPTAVLRSE